MRDFYCGLSKLSTDELIQISHDCEELLGAISVAEYKELSSLSRRGIYDRINSKKIKSEKLFGNIKIIMNDHLKNKL